MANLEKLFSPKSIAIVGASPKKGKLGNVLIENIRNGGWKGKLYFINPKYAKSRREYFASLADIKKPVDLVLIAVPATLVPEILENGANAKPKISNFTIISSGFKETGLEGRKIEEKLSILSRQHDLNILGPNCLGFTNQAERLNATFTDVKLKEGNIAIISQSGALAVALLDWATNLKIGFSKIISIGNKTVIDESKMISFLENDKQTKVIALYLEDIKSGSEFMQALAKTNPRKPVVILKAGKTSAGQKAVSSHTGSLAQDEEIIESVFEKLNAISADTIEEFQDLVYYLNVNPVPSKNEVIIITNAGGPGVMASDFIGKSKDLKLASFPEAFKKIIKVNLPESASVHNPIDVIGDAPPERYQKTLGKIADKYSGNPVIVILTPQNQSDPEKVARILAEAKRKIPNLSACFMGGEKISRSLELLSKNNIPNFESPERALTVIEKLAKYQAKNKNRILTATQPAQQGNAFKKAIAEKRKMLFWEETKKLFGKFQIKLAKSVSFGNIKGLNKKKIVFPCALKTDDPKISHRLEKKAVTLDIQNETELRVAFNKMKVSTNANHFLIQPMADPGLELIIGMKRDPTFGPTILCGWGGSFTEIFKDKIILIPPLDRNEIEKMFSQLSIFPILRGFRGKKGYNLSEISNIVLAIAQISLENHGIQEIDINPLVVYNNGKNGQILDAKIFL